MLTKDRVSRLGETSEHDEPEAAKDGQLYTSEVSVTEVLSDVTCRRRM